MKPPTGIALYPGTFDPVTNGHLDVIARAREIFNKVIVTVALNSDKNPMFTVQERVAMIRAVTKKYRNVTVETFDGLIVDFAAKKKAGAIVRGLRAVSDFEYELQMALMNRKLNGSVTTVFLMPHEKYTYLNSSIVREIARHGGDISGFVPPAVAQMLRGKVNS